ncbi:MAG: hypothetical protein ACI4KM_09500 [Oscillospiraceae bacterium]
MSEYLRILRKLRGGCFEPKNARTLGLITSGAVFPAGELVSQGGRIMGEGYAVKPQSRLFVYELSVTSPDDAVVTDISGKAGAIKLRNGDGIELEVLIGMPDISWNTEIGCKLCRGDIMCRLSYSEAESNCYGGAFAVLFSKPEQITELHIPSAKRRSGEAAAFYRVR